MGWIILAALLLDLLLGDPRWLPHPVVGMGWLINRGERLVRSVARSPKALKIGGGLLVLATVAITYWLTWLIIILAVRWHPYAGIAVSIALMSQALAVKTLYQHAQAVLQPLRAGNLPQARRALSMMVGRDTAQLDEAGLVRGVVETVAENTVDGVTAPLFYGFLGGPPLALAYKAINTLDSMIGYRNQTYREFGWAGAKLDDLANYIPARLTGLLYLPLAPFSWGGLSGVIRAIRQDAPRHVSPNSGIPEAAVAGLLGVRLGGLNYYQGVPSPGARMGLPQRPLQSEHIQHSLRIMLAVTAEAVLAGILLHWWLG